MDDKVKITFDKEYKIRALDPTKFEKGEALEKECSNFVEKISSFNEKVNTLVDILDLHANRIDAQKLRVSCAASHATKKNTVVTLTCYTHSLWFVILQAIGLRIAAESEAEQRIRQERALQTMINEKKAELDRYVLLALFCQICIC